MRQIVPMLIIAAGAYCAALVNRGQKAVPAAAAVPVQPGIRAIFFQDASQSIDTSGVSIIEPEVLDPYFQATGRDIDLNFGVIDELSADKLVSISLPAARFSKPQTPNTRGYSFVARRRSKEIYMTALQQYQKDSVQYFSDRKSRIKRFKKSVQEALAPYALGRAHRTDLVSAVSIAEKVCAYSRLDGFQNYILINSDGQDTRGRTAAALQNPATVYLINASGIEKTSIDAILTATFASPEQAIAASLR